MICSQQLESKSDIEITKVIPGNTDGVTDSIKYKKQTDEWSKNPSNLQNNYCSENYTWNEEITAEYEYSNNDIKPGTSIITTDDQVGKCTSMNVIGKMLRLFIRASCHMILMVNVSLQYLLMQVHHLLLERLTRVDLHRKLKYQDQVHHH